MSQDSSGRRHGTTDLRTCLYLAGRCWLFGRGITSGFSQAPARGHGLLRKLWQRHITGLVGILHNRAVPFSARRIAAFNPIESLGKLLQFGGHISGKTTYGTRSCCPPRTTRNCLGGLVVIDPEPTFARYLRLTQVTIRPLCSHDQGLRRQGD